MPTVQPPALWLSIAATAVSVVTVAAMANSSGPRRPLTFAGAVLLPGDQHGAASSPVPSDTTQPSRRLSRPSPPPTRTSTAPPAAASTAGYATRMPVIVPIQNTSSTRTPGAEPSTPAATAAPASRPPAQPHASQTNAPNPPGAGSIALAQALFTALNDARRQAGLPALSWSDRLQRSAAGHNRQMATANVLASRVGDEPALGVRQANQGVLGDYAAENVASTPQTGLAGALAAQQSMLAEQPLGGSHGQHLLSTAVNAVGIDVLLDPAHGRMWITHDFAQLS